jgi:MFS family permease
VRVFAALASFISAVLILYPVLPSPVVWAAGRIILGFCFSGVYVTAESWLNNSSSNENRGKALSVYMIVQMSGIVMAQGLLAAGDPSGYVLFVISSVLVSVSFAPILLSISPTPAFETTQAMSLRRLFEISPLGCVGMFLQGGAFSALFAMSAVYATLSGMSVPQVSMFVSAGFVGALVLQYPIGWFSDRMDRRLLILILAAIGGGSALAGFLFDGEFYVLTGIMFMIGGVISPLYALLIAYTNDFLETDDMTAASGGLIFISGLGAISGPLLIGWMMGMIGPHGFFAYMVMMLAALVGYAAYRMTQRAATAVGDTGTYMPISPTASAVVVELAQEVFIEASLEEDEKN